MQIQPHELDGQLSHSLASLYLVAGDEPLQLLEASSEVRAAARAAGCSERLVFDVDRSFDWDALLMEANSMSLFAERRLIELRLPSARPGKAGGAALEKLASRDSEDVCLVTMPAVDGQARRTAWFKALQQSGVYVDVRAVGPDRLPEWIARRFSARGVQADRAACELMAERTEGNMVAAAQAVELLCLLRDGAEHGTDVISPEDVVAASGDSARYDSFSLVNAVLGGDATRAVRIVRGLRAEGAPLPPLVGSLAWMLRAVVTVATRVGQGDSVANVLSDGQLAVWRQRRTLMQQAVNRHDAVRWREFLSGAFAIDRASKGMSVDDPWQLAEGLCVAMAAPAGAMNVVSKARMRE